MANWSTTATKAGTYTFKTAGTYADRNIDLTIPQGAATATATQTTAGTATMAETGFTAATSATDYYVTQSTTAGAAQGSASVSTAGWIDSVTTQTGSTSVAVTGNGEKLYIPTNTIAGSVTNLTAPSVAVSGSATGMETASSGNYYVTVTGTPTDGSVTGTATAGSTTGIVATSATNTSTATTITPGVTGSGSKVYIKEQSLGTSNSGTNVSTITPSTSTQYINATTGYQGTARKWTINPISSATAATYEGSTTTVATDKTVTRGDFEVKTVGYSGNAGKQILTPATFANSATSGTTYVDLSDTTTAPVLVSGSGLYINKGYVDNLYISLKKLSPDGASGASAIQAGMLDGISAYDNDGNLVTGNIATKTSTDITASGKTVTVPSGYYAAQYTKDVASGSYSVSASKSGTLSETIANVDGAGTAGGTAIASTATTTEPSSGYYVAVQSTGSGTVTVTPSATITSGYIANGASASSTTTASVSAPSSSVTYMPITKGTITPNTSGGTSTSTITAGKQIKISKGYYASDAYYTAQDASSTDKAKYTLSGTASGFTAATGTTSYYVTPSRTVTTAGYLSSSVDPTSTTKIYIPTTTITGDLSATSSSTSYTAPTLATSAPSGAYVTFVGKGTGAGTGMVSTSVTGSSTKYLPIYEGSYSIA